MNKKTIDPQRYQGVSHALFLGVTVALTSALAWLPSDALAHTGELFRDEIGKIEALFTGGYMRLGLLAVCGVTAIMGALKQNAWMFISGILAAVFAYFMKDWIMTTFTSVI